MICLVAICCGRASFDRWHLLARCASDPNMHLSTISYAIRALRHILHMSCVALHHTKHIMLPYHSATSLSITISHRFVSSQCARSSRSAVLDNDVVPRSVGRATMPFEVDNLHLDVAIIRRCQWMSDEDAIRKPTTKWSAWSWVDRFGLEFSFISFAWFFANNKNLLA